MPPVIPHAKLAVNNTLPNRPLPAPPVSLHGGRDSVTLPDDASDEEEEEEVEEVLLLLKKDLISVSDLNGGGACKPRP